MADARKAAQERLNRMFEDRGYVVGFHKLMVQADPDWVEPYDALVQRTYLRPGELDRKTKELCQVVVLAALRSDTEHIASHVRQAIAHGATEREVLEALECVLMLIGGLGFGAGLKAWASVVGLEELEPE